MKYHERLYDVYVLLGDPTKEPLWHWASWRQAVDILDPIIEAARGKPSMRSTQYPAQDKGTISFGRMGWNAKGHHKWTHGSPTTGDESYAWKFLSTEVWGPSWNECEKEMVAPDVYFGFVNEALTGAAPPLAFNPVVVFATSAELPAQVLMDARAVVSKLTQLMNSVLAVHQRRPWGYSAAGGFTGAIQDLSATGLFKMGPRHTCPPSLQMFNAEWRLLKK